MFDHLGPQDPAGPPAGALQDAVRRGRTLRRRRRAGVASAAALGLVLVGGAALGGPLTGGLGSVTVPPPPAAPAVTRDYSPIPENWSSEKGSLDVGLLQKVTVKDGVVTLHVDRELFYTGAGAEKVDPQEEELTGYVQRDPDGDRVLTFELDPRASIQAENLLRTDTVDGSGEGDVGRRTLSRDRFLTNARAALGPLELGPVLVWLRHAEGPDGPVTALAEQHTP